jgi:signal transduction histidine kinase/ActR/RegA family two-component response regulator
MRIRTRFLILVLAILVPAFVAAALAVGYVYLEERHAQEKSVAETTRAFALVVSNELETPEGVLKTLASSPQLAAGDIEGFYRHAKAMAPTPETTIVLLDLDQTQLMNTRVPLGTALPRAPVSPRFSPIAPQGAGERMRVSDLFVAPISKRYDFAIQVPVRIGGALRYYLGMGVNASTLQRLIEEQHFPGEWLVSLVDRNGKVIARSADADAYRGRAISSAAMQQFAVQREGVFPGRSLAGVDVQAFFSTVPIAGWHVIISIQQAELRRVPLHAAALLGGIMALTLVLALLAAGWLARRAAIPIEYLGKSAEDLAEGREVRYAAHDIVEIDAVARRMADASRQIRRAQAELEQRVAAAVADSERAQNAMLRSQKMEALGRLTGGIAHEFNNLLQTLTTALQMAALSSNQPRVQNLIETCKRTVSRATALTSRLGSFGRVQEARLMTVDPGDQVRGSLQLIRGVLRHGSTLEVQCAPELWPVTVDPLQFDLALLNLSINARDAMPQGGVLTIAVANCPLEPTLERPGGDYVRVSVSDTGTGMPPDVLARALDPFFTTKAPGQGSGLGLPQAYAFANQSHGYLAILSTEGAGTTVDIYLPRSSQPLSPQPARAARESVHATGRVLFVEDDPLVREAVRRGLAESGLEVQVADDGERALAMLDAGLEVDAVFSDIVMPGKVSGIDLATRLHAQRPELPIVLATGYTDQRVDLPGVQVLAKPYEIGPLVTLLGSLIKQRAQADPATGFKE